MGLLDAGTPMEWEESRHVCLSSRFWSWGEITVNLNCDYVHDFTIFLMYFPLSPLFFQTTVYFLEAIDRQSVSPVIVRGPPTWCGDNTFRCLTPGLLAFLHVISPNRESVVNRVKLRERIQCTTIPSFKTETIHSHTGEPKLTKTKTGSAKRPLYYQFYRSCLSEYHRSPWIVTDRSVWRKLQA
jgi:hypothetical protein